MYVVLVDLADNLLPRVSSIRCGEPGCEFLCGCRLFFDHLLLLLQRLYLRQKL